MFWYLKITQKISIEVHRVQKIQELRAIVVPKFAVLLTIAMPAVVAAMQFAELSNRLILNRQLQQWLEISPHSFWHSFWPSSGIDHIDILSTFRHLY